MTAAPGWYPDGSGALRRWDGTQWTHEIRPMPTTRPRLGPGWFRLAKCLEIVLIVATVANVANLFFSAAAWRTFARWADRPGRADPDFAETYDGVVVWSSVVLTLLHVTLFVLFVIWLYRAHHSDRMDPALLEHRSGWAIGGWFVPFLNLVRPYQMVEDVQRAAQTPGSRLPNQALWWWLPLVGACIANRITTGFLNVDTEKPRVLWAALSRAHLADSIASVLFATAGVAGLLLVRHLTSLVRASPHARA